MAAFRKNIVFALRNLLQCDSDWAKLFTRAFEEAVAATALAADPTAAAAPAVWPHLLCLGGLQHITGIGGVADTAVTMPELVARVLRHPLRLSGSTAAFKTLRARLLDRWTRSDGTVTHTTYPHQLHWH